MHPTYRTLHRLQSLHNHLLISSPPRKALPSLNLSTKMTTSSSEKPSNCSHVSDPSCIFCKIILGQIPSFKLVDNDTTFAFLDIGPISHGHALVIPKHHGAKLHDLPDAALKDILPTAKRIAQAMNLVDYNILQNNGRIAHQQVDHVHFHVIPKPSASDEEGLVIGWPTKPADMTQLGEFAKEIKAKLDGEK